jgi:hypothetical protein
MKLAVVFLACLCSATSVFAGSGNRTGTNGASELLIPIGTRDIAMGGSTVALSSGPEALFWNPAGIGGVSHNVTLYASHMSYIADIGVECASAAVDFGGFGVLALQLKALAIGTIPVTTVTTPDGSGQTFTPQFFTIGLTYGRQLTDRIRVGVTATLISETMAEVSATGFAFDVGVIYSNLAGVQGLNFGVVVKNIGPQMKFSGPGMNVTASPTDLNRPAYVYSTEAEPFELPSTIEFGFGYQTTLGEDATIAASTAFQNNNFGDDAYRIGIECGYQKIVFLRAGYDFAPPENTVRQNIFGAALGTGVHATVGTMEVTFDYAYRFARYFDGNHVFSMKLGL